ncbi:MAG: prepilin-type N-terminal cleavage/methylation domain-containing protein [Pirellulales bacterium]|nr:prepilin-type N-terminal cleavage/methylation domain-containing protein [Pirellulales bacterium]
MALHLLFQAWLTRSRGAAEQTRRRHLAPLALPCRSGSPLPDTSEGASLAPSSKPPRVPLAPPVLQGVEQPYSKSTTAATRQARLERSSGQWDDCDTAIHQTLAKPVPPRAELCSSEQVSGTGYLTYKAPRRAVVSSWSKPLDLPPRHHDTTPPRRRVSTSSSSSAVHCPLTTDHSPAKGRRGMTLVELLVVIFIVLTVTALAIPVIAPAMRGRQVREASRLVTAYLAGARSEALRTGRATGVIFERFPNAPEMCINLSRCQVPPTYAGDTTASRATATGNNHEFTVIDAWNNRVQPGDLIKFNYQGHLYRIVNATGSPKTCEPVNGTVPAFNLPAGTSVPYQVFRQPKRTSTPPVQLPAGIVIDLGFSGDATGNTGNTLQPFVIRDHTASGWSGTAYEQDPHAGEIIAGHTPLGIMVVFAPDGSVEGLYRPNALGVQIKDFPSGSIHFLIGQRARVPVTTVTDPSLLAAIELDSTTVTSEKEDLAEEQLATFNFMDLENLWVTINPRSGQINSTEMYAVPSIDDPTAAIATSNPSEVRPIADRVRQSRQFALEGQAMGGL